MPDESIDVSALDAHLTIALDGTILRAGPDAVAMFGYAAEEMVGHHVAMLAAESDRDGIRSFYRWLETQRASFPVEVTREVMRQHKGGRQFATRTTAIAVTGDDEDIVMVTCKDMRRQRAIERSLYRSEENLRALMNAPTVAAVLIDPAGTILALNRTAAARLGDSAQAHKASSDGGFVGTCVYDYFPEELRELRRASNEEVARTGQGASYEDERNGRWTHHTVDPIFDTDGGVVQLAVFSRDISERKLAQQKLEATLEDLSRSRAMLAEKSEALERALDAERERARLDALTGTFNHGAITEILLAEIGTGRGLAIAMVDVDGMKAANDTYGHLLGDALLASVAAALKIGDAIVGRYGGDEFLAVLPGADGAAAVRFKDSVYAALAAKSVADPETGATFPVLASIGLAVTEDAAVTGKQLLDSADAAMYEEKRARRAAPAANYAVTRRADDRAAPITGDLLPLLTLTVRLQDKLRLVSHRLSVACGYDAVNIDLYDGERAIVAQNAFAKAPEELLGAWNREQRAICNHPLGPVFAESREPVIVSRIDEDGPFTPAQRSLLSTAGIRSGVAVPMVWQDEIIGVVSVGSRREAAFGAEDGRLLTAVIGQITPVIRMAQEMEHLAERAARPERPIDERNAA